MGPESWYCDRDGSSANRQYQRRMWLPVTVSRAQFIRPIPLFTATPFMDW